MTILKIEAPALAPAPEETHAVAGPIDGANAIAESSMDFKTWCLQTEMLVEISGSESKIDSSYRELDDENNEVLNVNSILHALNFGLWLQSSNCVVITCCIIITQLQVFSCADSSVVQVPNENSFESDLYNSGAAVLSLFPGSNHTVLQSLVKYFSWFYEHPGINKNDYHHC